MLTRLAEVFVSVTLIWGFVSSQSEEEKIRIGQLDYDCISTYVSETLFRCPDYPRALECLNNITVEIKNSSSYLDNSFQYVNRLITENRCPGLREKNTCVEKGRNNCTQNVYKNYENNFGCGFVDEAVRCLEEMDKSCLDNLIRNDLRSMRARKEKCDSGYFVKGPCNGFDIDKCTEDLWHHITFGFGTHSCQIGPLEDARQCLKDLTPHCDTDVKMNLLTKEYGEIKYKCNLRQ